MTSAQRILAILSLMVLAPPLYATEKISHEVSSRIAHNPENSSAALEKVELSREDFNTLGREVARRVANGDPVGAEILVVQHDQTVLHEVYGWSDREEQRLLERNSIFRMRSMTKPLLGTAVLMLVEDGKLTLDDSVSQFLPSFDNDRSRSVTIRQLLTHTSGLGDHGTEEIGLDRDSHEYEDLRELVDDIGALGPSRASGEFHYSDSGSATLGAVVKQISGVPVERFIEHHILKPLAMADTHIAYEPGVAWAHRMNSTYRMKKGACELEKYWDRSMKQRFPYFRASGGLYSTVKDYSKFLVAWMKGGTVGDIQLLSRDTIKQALTPEGDRSDGRWYGMHWTIRAVDDRSGLAAVFGHGGSDGTLAIAFPDFDAIVMFFTQSRHSSSRSRFIDELARISPFSRIFPRDELADEINAQWELLHGKNESRKGTTLGAAPRSRKSLERYVGTYTHSNFTDEISVENNSLRFSFVDLSVTGPLFPVLEDVFLGENPCSGSMFRVSFTINDDGEVSGYSFESSDGFQGDFEKESSK